MTDLFQIAGILILATERLKSSQEDHAMWTKMAEVKHGVPIRPLGSGGARLLNGLCDAPIVERHL